MDFCRRAKRPLRASRYLVAPGVVVGLFVLMMAHVSVERRFAVVLLAVAAIGAVADGVVLWLDGVAVGAIFSERAMALQLVPWASPLRFGFYAMYMTAGV